MEKSEFDKENIPTVDGEDAPGSLIVFSNETVYDIREKRGVWWQCPKCGRNFGFDPMDEGFDEDLGKNQLFAVYSWSCEECGAEGSIHAVVHPQYITLVQGDDEG